MSKCKKYFAILLVLVMSFAMFAGCAKEEHNPAGTISDFESQTHFQPGTLGDESASGDTSKAPVSGEFVVSEKKYDYNGANLELLYVENQTNRHYNVTIRGKYLDENGDIIKEETQTFEGFPSGWSNNFIFYPRTTFDSFTYTVETEKCTGGTLSFDSDGNPLASYIELFYEKELHWQRGLDPINNEHPDNAKEIRELMFSGKPKNRHATSTIGIEFHLVILDANGEIYITDYDFRDLIGFSNGWRYEVAPVQPEDIEYSITLKEQDVGHDETIPDTVQGVFTAIFAVNSVYDYDAWLQSVIG